MSHILGPMTRDLENILKEDVPEMGLNPKFDVLRLLSEQLYSDRAQPLYEYLRNSSDADARNITVEARRDSILIQDDGEGMTPEGLVKFLQVGGSPRARQGTTASGRKVMGRYGVGNMAALAIGEGYRVTTVKEGIKTEYDLNFRELEEAELNGKPFHRNKSKPRVSRADGAASGTTIEIYGLNNKYKGAKQRQVIELLEKEVGRKMKALIAEDGSSIRINGKEVPHYIDQFLEGATEVPFSFTIDDDEGLEHQVNGWYKVAQRALAPEDAGVFPVVNGEITIKDGHMYQPSTISGFIGLRNKIYGEVEADFLSDLLTTSRDQFRDSDSPLVTKLYQGIREQMTKLAREVEAKNKDEAKQALDEVYAKVTTNVSYALNQQNFWKPNQEEVDDTKDGGDKGPKRKKRRRRRGTGNNGCTGDQNRKPRPPKVVEGRKELRFAGHRFILNLYQGSDQDLYMGVNGPANQIDVNLNHPMHKKVVGSGAKAMESYMTCNLLKVMVEYIAQREGMADMQQINQNYNSALARTGKING